MQLGTPTHKARSFATIGERVMTEFNKSTQKKDWDALAEKRLAAIKRSTKATTEDAVVRAAHKVMAEFEARNAAIEEVAQHIEKLQGFGKDTVDSLAIYIREMKK
jgi:predicted extracellular nuclease